MKTSFPLIKNLMGAYLNQDYDYICETDSIEGAMDYYISDCPAGVLAELIDEFELFLSNYPDNPDKAFEEIFQPGIIITDIRAFFGVFTHKIIGAGKR
ncbi:contact-dependent growth inhibition system immunity protein [Tatumella sp. UCD-D_suzukii]|uniref:contact-dependent growth inhibition system immunity protein n=1 Tax=Tatumella sp. UCD-D_suzukii TaxID=1408192 RepID=UPI000472D62D|nr:contact-dependent growth inhibition system immunity protein [Tatumella sp. UCD-D_suzukii]